MTFEERKANVEAQHEAHVTKKNSPIEGNGVFCRWENPIITAETAPLTWRYDYNPETNPYFMERIGLTTTASVITRNQLITRNLTFHTAQTGGSKNT